MKRTAAAILTTLFLAQAGCDSENTKTYEFSGVWDFSGVSGVCSQPVPPGHGEGMLDFLSIVVEVYNKETDEEPIVTETVDCDDGIFTIDDLKRGSYFVKVNAMAEDPVEEIADAGADSASDVENPDPEIRAYYVGTETVVVPSSDHDPVTFDMSIGTGAIEVSWDFDKGACSSSWNNVEKVSVELQGERAGNDRESGDLDCDATGQSYLFDGLSWDVYTVTVKGYDPNGEETHYGSFDAPVEIRPGTEISGLDGLIELEPID